MSGDELFSDEVRQGRRSRYRFTQTPQWALLMTDLSDAGYRTYCLLLAHVNAERGDGAVWPQQKSLGAMLGKRGEAISRVVTKELEPLGLVDVEEVRTGANKTRRRNIYTVHEEPPATWEGFASIQEWYAAQQKPETAGQPGDAKNRVSGDAKNRYAGDAIHRASGDAKNRAENYTNHEQDEEEGKSITSVPATRSPDPARDRSDVERVCKHLADRIEGNGCKRPSVTKKWLDSARLLIDKDGRTEEQVHAAIDWCQDNDFWRANILSMPKLREKYDTLRLQAQREAVGGAGGRGRGQQQDTDAMFDRAMQRAQARMQQSGAVELPGGEGGQVAPGAGGGAGGEVVPFPDRHADDTDAMFDRAMQRAQARMQQREAGV